MRVAIQALAGVFGGTQSLHTDAYDGRWLCLRIKRLHRLYEPNKIIAEETGVANTVDPLAVLTLLALTDKMELGALDYFQKLTQWAGWSPPLKKDFRNARFRILRITTKSVEQGDQVIVGVNKYEMDEQSSIPILAINESVRAHQIERLDAARSKRDGGAVQNALEKLKRAAQNMENTMPATIEAVRAYATLGEICSALRDVYGVYEEPAF